jgi:hypothetical protein
VVEFVLEVANIGVGPGLTRVCVHRSTSLGLHMKIPGAVVRSTEKPRMARRKVATAGRSEGAVSGELDDSAVQRNDAMCR